jgi:transcriptional regulator with XRE-family HTH domain
VTPGERLRLLLAARPYVYRDLVKRAGIGYTTLTNVLSDRNVPRPVTAASLAGALEVPAAALTDDVECIRAVCQLVGVAPALVSGAKEVSDLLRDVGPDRAQFVFDQVRATLRLIAPDREPAPLSAADAEKGKP